MYKLLTPEETAKVRREYVFRRAGVMLGLISTLMLVAIAALLPSLIFARGKKDAALYTLSTISMSEQSVDKSLLEKWVLYTNNELNELGPETYLDRPYDHLQKVLKSRPSGSKVTGFIWTRGAGNFRSVKVRGEASTRQSLLQFQENLQDTGDWTQVDFPVSTIAKEADIDFELSLIPTPKRQ